MCPLERKPRICPFEQGGIMLEMSNRPPRQEPWGCILGSDNMETDRPLEIGNLRKKIAWGEHFPQIANRPCSVCHGDMALTDAKPAFGPAERKGGLRGAPRGLQTAGSVAQDVGDLLRIFGKIAPKIWGLSKQSGAWISNLGHGTDCRELWLRCLGLGQVIWGLD